MLFKEPTPISDAVMQLHRDIGDTTRQVRQAEVHLAALLRQLQDERGYEQFGYSSITHYAETEHDIRPGTTLDLVRLSRRLDELPVLEMNCKRGEIPWSKAREVARVAVAATEDKWIDVARQVNCRQLERLVADAKPGDAPAHPDHLPLAPSHLQFSVKLDVADHQIIGKALALVRSTTDEDDLDDARALTLMAAMVLECHKTLDPGELSSANYRVHLMRCPDCDRHWQHGPQGMCEVSDAVAQQAGCDCETVHIDDAIQDEMPAGLSEAAFNERGDTHVGFDEPGGAPMAHVGETGKAADDRPNDSRDTHVGRVHGRAAGHVTRGIAPARRREIVARDWHQCAVPGCRCRVWIEIHHLRPRKLGGKHALDNLLVLCSTHHRLVHEGLLHVERLEDGSLSWRRRDGMLFGAHRPDVDGTDTIGTPQRSDWN